MRHVWTSPRTSSDSRERIEAALQVTIRDEDLASYFEDKLELNQVEPISSTLGNLGGFGAVDGPGNAFCRSPFNGSIDELMVFDRVLTAEEVLALYQNFRLYEP